MKLNIPFYSDIPIPSDPEGKGCTECCLQMLLGHFEPDRRYSLEEVEKITGKHPEKATWSMQWSIWFANHGYEVKHYSTFDYAAFQTKGAEYIRQAYGDEVAQWQIENSDIDEARNLTPEYMGKINIVKKKPAVSDIKDAMKKGYAVKVQVNQRLLNGAEGYVGHSVVVTDIDDENVWIHDPGLPAFENKKVSKDLLQEAMDSFGGEMDAIRKRF